ncbi:hypothetical protein I7I48_02425 [Histoplasma ohiense]|nr:hypothetical protein I7I48_02425 [Histoplasma ohiense (nom. inval.)]
MCGLGPAKPELPCRFLLNELQRRRHIPSQTTATDYSPLWVRWAPQRPFVYTEKCPRDSKKVEKNREGKIYHLVPLLETINNNMDSQVLSILTRKINLSLALPFSRTFSFHGIPRPPTKEKYMPREAHGRKFYLSYVKRRELHLANGWTLSYYAPNTNVSAASLRGK